MKSNQEKSNKQLIEPSKKLRKTVDGKEVALEELESLCDGFDRRPRGCNNTKSAASTATTSFSSIGDNDDVLF